MPYLNSKIEKHNDGCKNPVAKRIYVRDYDDKGKQRFVSYGLTCPSCNIIIKEEYQRNPTAVQKKKHGEYTPEQEKEFASIDLEYMPKVIFSENSKAGKAVVKEWTQKLIDSGMSKENAIDHITGRDRPGSTTKYQIF